MVITTAGSPLLAPASDRQMISQSANIDTFHIIEAGGDINSNMILGLTDEADLTHSSVTTQVKRSPSTLTGTQNQSTVTTTATPASTNTPTPTPTPTPDPASPTESIAIDAGKLSPPSPPETTLVEHTLSVNFNEEIQNGTDLVFPSAYEETDFQIQSVSTTEHSQSDSTVRGRLTTVTTVVQNQSVRQPAIALVTEGTVRNITVDMTVQHHTVQNATQYNISAVAPDADPATVFTYSVRPVGSDHRATISGEFDRADGTGFIYPNATVYRGERDISFRGNLTSPLRSVAGENEGTLLAPPIPTDATVGTYSVGGKQNTASIQVQNPEITTLRLENSEGADVTGGKIYTGKTDTVTLIAQSNFEDAEQLELTVRNADGTDITRELIDTATVRAETEFGQPATESVTTASTPTTVTNQPIQSTATTLVSTPTRHPTLTTNRFSYRFQSQVNGVNLEAAGVGTEQAQIGETTEPDLERRINQTDIEPGETVSVNLTATVGSNGELELAEQFSPAVQEAKITSTSITETGVSPDIAAARTGGLLFKVTGVSSGAQVEINYQIKTKPIDETYALDGFVRTDGARTEFETAEIVAGSGGAGSSVVSGGQVRWQLDVSDIDAQTLTTEITGSDDLDTGSAQSTAQLTISDASPRLSISETQPNRRDSVTVSVLNGVYGSEYTIGISTADIQDDVPPSKYQSVFQNVGTTTEIDVIGESDTAAKKTAANTDLNRFVYARVSIDSDSGTGETKIQTKDLDDAVTVKVVPHDTNPSALIDEGQIIDEKDIVITDPDITLSGPDGYIPGDQTTLRGDAESGVDTAVMYVRSPRGSQYELVDLDSSTNGKQGGLSVSGGFSKDVVLSVGDAPGNQILTLPGTYQVAMQSKATLTETRNKLPQTISRAEFLSESPSLHTIQVRRPNVTLEQPGMDGKVADTQDIIKINGSVEGRDVALIVAIGSRGEVETKLVDGPTFSGIDLSVDEFSTGQVTVYVISTGRDGQIGDGNFDEIRVAEVEGQLSRLQNQLQEAAADVNNTGDQVRALLRTETDLDTASDDPVVSKSIQIVPSSVDIDIPKENTTISFDSGLRVTGSTTVAPYSEPLSILLSRGPGTQARTQIQQWENGRWNTTLSTTNLTPGRYQITAIIGGKTATRTIKLTAQGNTTGGSIQTPATANSSNTGTTRLDQTSVPTSDEFNTPAESVSQIITENQPGVLDERTQTEAEVTETVGNQSLTLPTLGGVVAIIMIVTILAMAQRDN